MGLFRFPLYFVVDEKLSIRDLTTVQSRVMEESMDSDRLVATKMGRIFVAISATEETRPAIGKKSLLLQH